MAGIEFPKTTWCKCSLLLWNYGEKVEGKQHFLLMFEPSRTWCFNYSEEDRSGSCLHSYVTQAGMCLFFKHLLWTSHSPGPADGRKHEKPCFGIYALAQVHDVAGDGFHWSRGVLAGSWGWRRRCGERSKAGEEERNMIKFRAPSLGETPLQKCRLRQDW